MITQWDEYPVHQTPDPIAYPGTSDRNFYDRYFFHGYDVDRGLFFGAALGFYPNRGIVDGAFSVSFQERQYIVHASKLVDDDRSELGVGPIRLEVIEPLRSLRIFIEDNPWGIQADLYFMHRTPPIEEPRFRQRTRARLWMDYTRMTQHGRWRGWVSVENLRTQLQPEKTPGARDRSWGIRPVGEPEGGAVSLPWQFFWLWGPIHFPDRCIHFTVSEYADGTRWHEYAVVIDDSYTEGARPRQRLARVHYNLELRSGTRQIHRAEFALELEDRTRMELAIEPILHFYMAGLGYGHPQWGHGRYLGDHVVAGEVWDLKSIDPAVPLYFHVQSLSRVRTNSSEGIGVVEQLMIGPHAPTGLSGLFDPAP